MWGERPISARRLRSLVAGIPAESALGFATKAFVPGWSNTEELLSVVAQLVDEGNRLFIMANSKKGTRPPVPIKITRPGESVSETSAVDGAPKTKRQATSDELRAFFGGSRRVHYTPATGAES